MNDYNVSYTKKNNLCLGCGLCSDACPTGSIEIKPVNGEYRPFINESTCNNSKGCHRCSMVCPGVGVQINGIGKEKFGNSESNYHKLIGWYKEAFSGHALDFETRFHGASGGILSAFVAYLLDKKIISAVVVAENDMSRPFLNKTVLVHDSKELYKARSSKYCPVTFSGIIKQVKQEEGQVIIVGSPCAIQGFRKYEKIDSKFRDKVFGLFGLYCSCGRSFNLTEYVFKKRKIEQDKLTYFQYRDEGCLGSLIARTDREYKEEFQLYYHPLRSFFIPNRCQFCIDHYSELADMSFGDIHYGKYKDDKIGVNSLVVRNAKFSDLLRSAANDGYIKLDPLSEEELIKCQHSAPKKKGRVGGVLRFAKTLGLKVPEYDVELKNYSYIKSIAYYLFAKSQMFVGRRRWLWWIIPFVAKKGKVD
ncbi:Coenzyme F420-reducing hydrogenase, beta subunit [Fibrobacter sp. UWH5]|uniref:Coenzyme F420 hydrogenase/dehydrogenase, beta subunit C-terminal domain n=1 Tax=Fibrobacter sp. UWH5 TaxID=1896211 RepID=UPI0009151552|nr:Coenzyme F420 hydrogenase/dehydrogenase, beta subunit C-terminal domain [Fibrobacter sp. UWH5]SHL04748.1 Coenzyme F420-reducing hydrogenase, beta subunit [Fibrobacter sp. UWH5]